MISANDLKQKNQNAFAKGDVSHLEARNPIFAEKTGNIKKCKINNY